MASRFIIYVALAWAGAPVGVASSCFLERETRQGSLDPTVCNVLTVLDLWLPFGTLGRMLCLSARLVFVPLLR